MRLVFGLQPVRESIRAHRTHVERVFVEQGSSAKLAALARFARDQGVAVEIVRRADIERQAGTVHHQGVMAIAPDLELVDLDALEVSPSSVFLVLDEIQDPQNFGAVIRSAVALGAQAVVWAEHASAPLSPATFRASAGAIEHARLCRVGSLVSALQKLASAGATAVALDPTGADQLWSVDLTGPVSLVIGSEGKGIRKSVRAACERHARLPMSGPVESLNASVAAALALFETARQRAPVR